MLHLFRKQKDLPVDFTSLEADMHAHLLPGIDDGAPDMATTLTLIQGLRELGYRKLFATPHIMHELYPNKRGDILRLRDQVLEAMQRAHILSIEFDAAAEYFVDEHFDELQKKEALLTLPGSRVLIELSFHQPYPAFHRVLFELQMNGYQPVLAHPERYPYFHTPDDFYRLKHQGCAFQVNILSLTGYYGNDMMKTARMLHQNGWIDFLGTDLHHERHLGNLKNACTNELVAHALQSENLQNRFLMDEKPRLNP